MRSGRIASAALLALALSGCAGTPWWGGPASATVTAQPAPGAALAPWFVRPQDEAALSDAALQELLRQKIRYVFVIFNENHSFDNEFGTFPGVNGLYSDGQRPRGPDGTPGFTQSYTDLAGQTITVAPFRIGPEQNGNVIDSVDHAHIGLAQKLHVDPSTGRAAMDQFAAREYGRFAASPGASAAAQAEGRQFARLVMSHVDCDTIPFLWNWASRFTIFDNIFATEDTPSTPNAIAMVAGQAGETQWVRHPGPDTDPTATGIRAPLSGIVNGVDYTGQTATTHGPPLVTDPQPWYGSEFDATVTHGEVRRQPPAPNESYAPNNIASNLTFASLPLTLMGRDVARLPVEDLAPAFDLADIGEDLAFLSSRDRAAVPWRWYQEGYGHEASDGNGAASHAGYVSHHNGPQYFGYIANHPGSYDKLRGLSALFGDLAQGLPDSGVFYVRGGYANQMRLTPYTHPGTPADEVAAIVRTKSGDDDHPAYSDRQISEAMAARVVNAIAGNPELWSQSAIILTYDESDGFYDHVPPRILSYGPDGLPLSRGIRVPLLLISPYARSHAVSHVEGDHNAVIETINAIFALPPLSSLPDEAAALRDGDTPAFNRFGPPGFRQTFLGPRDTPSAISASLLSGFSPDRLLGRRSPLPASLAMIPEAVVTHLPHYDGRGCSAIGMRPVAPAGRDKDFPPPPGFNPLPSTWPAGN